MNATHHSEVGIGGPDNLQENIQISFRSMDLIREVTHGSVCFLPDVLVLESGGSGNADSRRPGRVRSRRQRELVGSTCISSTYSVAESTTTSLTALAGSQDPSWESDPTTNMFYSRVK